MGKYTVTYADGVTEEVQLFGPMKERERRLEWLKTVDSPGNYKKAMDAQRQAEREKANTEAKQVSELKGLPKLQGSDKQVTWAETIRVGYVKKLDDFIDRTTSEDTAKGKLSKEEYDQYLKPINTTAIQFRDEMLSKPNASWWIENRDKPLNVFYKEVSPALFEKHRQLNTVARDYLAKREATKAPAPYVSIYTKPEDKPSPSQSSVAPAVTGGGIGVSETSKDDESSIVKDWTKMPDEMLKDYVKEGYPKAIAEQSRRSAKQAKDDADQKGISAMLQRQNVAEKERQFNNLYESLLKADSTDKAKVVNDLDDATARRVLDALNMAPGDDPKLRQALNAKLETKEQSQTRIKASMERQNNGASVRDILKNKTEGHISDQELRTRMMQHQTDQIEKRQQELKEYAVKNIGSEVSPIVSPYYLPAYKKDGLWYYKNANGEWRHSLEATKYEKESIKEPYSEWHKRESAKLQPKPQTSLAIPAESLTTLRAVNNERKPSSISRDNAAQNKKTIESTDPRVEQWKRHPGSMDVLGVDTPPSVTKITSIPKMRTKTKRFGGRR